jgi:hypothetical protein
LLANRASASVKRTTGAEGLPGIEEILKRARSAKGVEAGILAGTGEHPLPVKRRRRRNKKSKNMESSGKPESKAKATFAEIAFWMEFGVKTATMVIPARPWMRLSMRKNRNRYRKLQGQLIKSILRGKISDRRAQRILGFALQRDLQSSIRELKTPPNSPLTIALKGSKNPLIDSGLFVRHIAWGDNRDR